MLKKIIKALVSIVDDVLLIAGLALVSIGVFKIYIPAGFIMTGICCIAFAYFFVKRR